ncbi:hypothetical protein Tco_1347093 [Tanacetum coccineum]
MSGLLGSLFFDGEQRVRQSGSEENDESKKGVVLVSQVKADFVASRKRAALESRIKAICASWFVPAYLRLQEHQYIIELKTVLRTAYHICFGDNLRFTEPSSAFESSLRCRKTKSGPQDTRVCTVMLTVKSEFVTAGMFRVFGEETAELSIVAISEPYKQKV